MEKRIVIDKYPTGACDVHVIEPDGDIEIYYTEQGFLSFHLAFLYVSRLVEELPIGNIETIEYD